MGNKNKLSFSFIKNTGIARNFYVFLACVLISSILWLLIILNKDYTTTIKLPVRFQTYAKSTVITNKLPEFIQMDVHGEGHTLVGYKLKRLNDTLVIDVVSLKRSNKTGQYYILTNSRITRLSRQLENSVEITKIIPDTIFFEFEKKITKKVKVRPKLNMSFEKQYNLSAPVEVTPDSITITGPKSIVDSINSITTKQLVLPMINKPGSHRVGVYNKFSGTVSLSDTAVSIYIPVEKYTENIVEVMPEVINLPSDYFLRLFPEKVKIRYLVSLENFDKIKPDMFQIYVDYNETKSRPSKISVKKKIIPSKIQVLEVFPEKVEYIIRKK